MKILITGATGNIGKEIIKNAGLLQEHILYVTTHTNEPAITIEGNTITTRLLDFVQPDTFDKALDGMDVLFLLRPPQLAEVDLIFKPLIDACMAAGTKHIVFLSVQGAEAQKLIPHHKIEKLIAHANINYTFLRPGYFMQNLTTSLQKDIANHDEIFLPAGDALFNWTDAGDIGLAAAHVLIKVSEHVNTAYIITGSEQLNFKSVAACLSKILQRNIKFESPNLLRFYLTKRRQGVERMYIFVMIMLHYLPRFLQVPPLSDDFERLTGRKPKRLEEFVKENQILLS